MITVAIDSAGRAGGIAVLKEDALIYESYLDVGLTHSETLLPMLKSALAAAGITIGQVGLLAVSAGPGSFTGLRIGMAMVKGLALPGDIPCVGVSTLEALARSVFLPAGSVIIPSSDARRGEVYAAAFRITADGCCRLSPDDTGKPEALLEPVLENCTGPVYLIGDGAQVCYNKLKDTYSLVCLPERWRQSRAAGVAYAALEGYRQGKAVSADCLAPDYHRLSQAQRERQERLEKEKLERSEVK